MTDASSSIEANLPCNGGELVVRTLLEAGAERIFALHGAHIDTIFQACLDQSLPIIDTRHEVAAGHAAEGYARATQRFGVALVTAGGGFTNVLTSVANAWLDRTPVVYITGSGALADDESNALQAGIDQVSMAKPVTKWAHRVLSTAHIPRLLNQAIRIALASPRGPVLLDIPWDILAAPCPDTPQPPSAAAVTVTARPDPDSILARMMAASRPLIILGSDANRADTEGLSRLAAATGAPVFAEFEALGLLSGLPGDLHGGLLQGLHGLKPEPDLALLLGARFGLHTAFGAARLIPQAAQILQVDADAREIGRLRAVEQGIVADPSAMLDALASASTALPSRRESDWPAVVKQHVEARYASVETKAAQSSGFHPFHASQVIERHVGPSVTVVADGALTYLWLSEVMSRCRPAAFLCHGYLGSMGVGFGTAVGAQAAGLAKGQRTLLVTGDGAVGYSLAEFDTCVRNEIPLIVIVMNNRSWGATLHFQHHAVGANRITKTTLENGDYHLVAKALGADAYLATTAAEFDEALSAALARSRPACINVMVERDPVPPEEMVIMGLDPFGGS